MQMADGIERMCLAVVRVDRIVESRETTVTDSYVQLLKTYLASGPATVAQMQPAAEPEGTAAIGGVDGCPAGWLVLVVDPRNGGKEISPAVLPTTESLFKSLSDLKVVTIDIPIGLTDRAPRQCDTAARKLLGPRASSVFPAPVRAALAATDYREACRLSEAACGKRLSRQAFAILPRIREVDALLRRMPSPQARVREVHPEVCFYFLAQGRPMRHAKKSREGLAERLELLETHFPGAYHKTRSMLPKRDVADDDIVDALAALWTARRVLRGEARVVPDAPAVDGCGLTMEMVA